MAAVSPTSTPKFSIPVIDVSSFLLDPSSPEAEAVVADLNFFQITGHGVASALQDSVFDAARAFFSLSDDEKKKYAGTVGRGYEVIGAQALDPSTKPDIKEGYFIGRELPNRKPPYRAFEHPNIWPTPVIPVTQFKDPLLDYHGTLTNLACNIIALIGRGHPGLTKQILTDFCRDSFATIRLLHYPPHPETNDPETVGAGAHTDFGAITLLLQDGHSGLQILRQDTQTWVDVPPTPHAYVVNVGDLLGRWTSGKYKSTAHRVINRSGMDRSSVPFFFDENLDVVVMDLENESAPGETVEEHLLRMYEKVYL
ncbi:hypothetical protein BJY04DRAFT_214249 [Aspergillus karnatakaensis]|uniref:isopenicillin N synthase family dioxygenase n=1 Tax=Aspergillus karnatakaensis TaxID=1810916 RepID=UPI003CCD88D7